MSLGERIKMLRQEKGLTHTQLAAQFEKSEGAIRNWETGRSKPDADQIVKLCQAFDCSADFILGLSDDKNRVEIEYKDKILTTIQRFVSTMTEREKRSYYRVVTLVGASFLCATETKDVADTEKLSDYTHLIEYLSAFFCAKYGLRNIYSGFTLPDDIDDDTYRRSMVLVAFELKNEMDGFVRNFLEIPEENDKDFDADYDRLVAFYENLIKQEEAPCPETPPATPKEPEASDPSPAGGGEPA